MSNEEASTRIAAAAAANAKALDLSSCNLTGEQLSVLYSAIAQLTNLQALSLNDNQLSALPPVITQLTNLQTLYLDGNQLSALPPDFAQLTNLQTLSLNGNQLSALPPDFAQLTNLQTLYLNRNQLSALPPDFAQLTNLQTLALNRNQLSALPPEFAQLDLSLLDLRNNSQLQIAEELVADYNNPQKILNFYFQSRTGKPINEAKIVVIGESDVGKTSLIKRLLYGTFDPKQDKTHGIEVYPWNEVAINDHKVRLNVWDFGGQEIMHATHQFFFTNRTLYVLVVNARENQNEQRADYWLTKIKSLAKDSPVIIVGNKLDQAKGESDLRGSFQIDEHALRAKYPNITGVHGICCDTGKPEYDADFTGFDKALKSQIALLDEIHKPFPPDWLAMKEHLETMPEDFISYDEYLHRCHRNGITRQIDQETLIEFLHELGIVLSFRKDRRLQDTQVRNPKWVTKGVYAIVESQKIRDNNGKLDLDLLSEILDPVAYPPHKHLFIIDMMRKFELCYDILPDRKFLIPGSLPDRQPYLDEWHDTLNFQYKYETYFGSIISRFIVKMHLRIDDHFVWRHGVILKHKDNQALIKADPQDKTVTIAIRGKEFTSRDFLSMIRDKFDDINADFSMIIEERVPIPGHPGYYEDYQHLLNLEELRKVEIIPRGLKKEFGVRKLLNNIESELHRQERQEKRAESNKFFPVPDIKAREKNLPAPIADNSSAINRKQETIKRLEDDISELNKKKRHCDEEAKFKPKVYAILFFIVLVSAIAATLYFAIFSGNPNLKFLLSAFTAALLILSYVVSAMKLKEWSPGKFPEQLYDKHKKLLYEKFGFHEPELVALNQELSERKRELRKLTNPVE